MNYFKLIQKRNNSKFILKTERGQEICTREISIIDNNFEGLVPLKVVRYGLKYQIEYELTGKVPIAEFFSDITVDKDLFVALLKKICLFIQNLNRLYMSTDKIIWDINYIYTDENDLNPTFIYLPLQPCEKNATVKNFFLDLPGVIEFDKGEDLLYLRCFVDMINTNGFVTELLLKNYVKRFDEDNSFGLSNEGTELKCPICNTRIELGEEICPACGFSIENCPEKVLLDEKTKANEFYEQPIKNQSNKPILRSQDAEILIENVPFNIGKDHKLNDYVIDTNVVSRQHAQIFKIGDSYYLIDFDSKNGTFLNEKQINSGDKIQISNQDRIRFADKEFVFIV